MGNGNGKPPAPLAEREVTLHVPEGMDKTVAEMTFRHLLEEFHALEPLALQQAKDMAAQGVLNDMPSLAKMRRMISEAPPGSHWGIHIAETQKVFMPGGSGNQIFIEAACRMREAKEDNLNLVIGTLTCWALLTSPVARGLLAMHGFGMKLQGPFVRKKTVEEGAGS